MRKRIRGMGVERKIGIPSSTDHSFKLIQNSFREGVQKIAAKSIANAGQEEDKQNVRVAVDGSYKQRGFNSDLSYVPVISTATQKILDICCTHKNTLVLANFYS